MKDFFEKLCYERTLLQVSEETRVSFQYCPSFKPNLKGPGSHSHQPHLISSHLSGGWVKKGLHQAKQIFQQIASGW